MIKRKITTIVLALMALIIVSSCSKDDESDAIVVNVEFDLKLININGNSAEISCTVSNTEAYSITEYGICWSTTENPTYDDNKIEAENLSETILNKTISELIPSTDYYVKAFVTINNTTNYSTQLKITTTDGLAKVTTYSVVNITATSAESGGKITDDGGFEITSHGLCWGTSENPTITSDNFIGTSGDGAFTTYLSDLTEWTRYYLRSYAENEAGIAYGEEFTFIANNPVTDYDGNKYQTIKIGEQIWMAENLKTSHYANGTEIDLASSNTDWDQLTNEEGAYCYYNNSASNGAEYGALYNWAAAMNGEDPSFNNPSGVQGVCPDGWHLPSDEEFIEMELYLGMSESEANTFGERGNQGTKLKSITGWDSDGNGTNESGFNALASGYRIQGGQFADLGAETIFITSTIFDDNTIYSRQLSTYGNEVIRVVWYQEMGLSVRCVKN